MISSYQYTRVIFFKNYVLTLGLKDYLNVSLDFFFRIFRQFARYKL